MTVFLGHARLPENPAAPLRQWNSEDKEMMPWWWSMDYSRVRKRKPIHHRLIYPWILQLLPLKVKWWMVKQQKVGRWRFILFYFCCIFLGEYLIFLSFFFLLVYFVGVDFVFVQCHKCETQLWIKLLDVFWILN